MSPQLASKGGQIDEKQASDADKMSPPEKRVRVYIYE